MDSINRALKRIPVLPLYFLGIAPAFWLLGQAVYGNLGADPVRSLEHGLGQWALRFMIATLCVTPLQRYAGLNLVRFRRCLGLTAFYLVLAHLGVYLVLDRQLAWTEVVVDLTKRPYIIVGMLAFTLMLPLALTSTDRAIRALGAQRWRALHRLAYPVGLLMVLHYLWLVKAWTTEPLIYAAIMVGLVAIRLAPDPRRSGGPRRAQARSA